MAVQVNKSLELKKIKIQIFKNVYNQEYNSEFLKKPPLTLNFIDKFFKKMNKIYKIYIFVISKKKILKRQNLIRLANLLKILEYEKYIIMIFYFLRITRLYVYIYIYKFLQKFIDLNAILEKELKIKPNQSQYYINILENIYVILAFYYFIIKSKHKNLSESERNFILKLMIMLESNWKAQVCFLIFLSCILINFIFFKNKPLKKNKKSNVKDSLLMQVFINLYNIFFKTVLILGIIYAFIIILFSRFDFMVKFLPEIPIVKIN